VTLREGFEAALLIGIVLAVLHQSGAVDRRRFVWAGVAAAVAVSLVAGAILFAAGGELEGAAEELFESGAMLTAVVVLTWMMIWMQRQARTLGAEIRDRVSGATSLGGAALFWIAFVMVVREGLETALFLFAGTADGARWATVAGGLTGLAVAVVLGYAVYRGGTRVNTRAFFLITSVLLMGFAAYLLVGAMHELGELAGSEALEASGPFLAGAYVLGMLAITFIPHRRTGRASG
jgi:high-affinity iron transporter